MRAASAGAISPRATAARTVDSTCRKSSTVRNDVRSIPRCSRRVDGGERRRQDLRGEGPQQMRLAVEQIRQCLRAQRPGHEIRHAPPGIGNAARPAARVAGASLGEAPARVARATQRGIRSKLLRFLNSWPGEQVITGRIGGDFRHGGPMESASERGNPNMCVLDMFWSRRLSAPGQDFVGRVKRRGWASIPIEMKNRQLPLLLSRRKPGPMAARSLELQVIAVLTNDHRLLRRERWTPAFRRGSGVDGKRAFEHAGICCNSEEGPQRRPSEADEIRP